MKRFTYVPGLAQFAFILFIVICARLPLSDNFRKFGLVLLLLLPVCALGEFAAFGYDVATRKNKLLSREFAPRLAFHVLATVVGIGVFVLWVALIRLGPIGSRY